ncbi:MAG: mannitol dehydrogenase family protein [Ruminococcus sp.]|nr:mannitol dehydrogenase family protein [Ruminococcus sp.]
MQLTEAGIKNGTEDWVKAGYRLPQFDHEAMVKATEENPYWVHFGAGNIFKAFQANVVQDLLNDGTLDRGIIAVGGHEAMEKLSQPHDNYHILVTLKADGTIEKTVVGSIAESLTTDAGYDDHIDRLKEIFRKDSLQMASFTITEKGYILEDLHGELLPAVAADLKNGPEKPGSYMGKITAFLYERFKAGQTPIAMVSMDNCSHNGTKLYQAIETYAKAWAENGLVEKEFENYITNPEKVSFPWSMIDKITPRPDPTVEASLKEDNIDGVHPIITSRKTFIAPYVNAEESQYLVIEDRFPNGRPALEKGGLIFTDRETVDKVETMKVCTCLNPLHTTLAVFGCVLGYERISQEMKDDTIRRLVEGIGYKEGLPVVVDPGVLDPKEFIDTVINVRIPNPFMPDTPQRIAVDTSQKLAIRFGETIKKYAEFDDDDLDINEIKLIPLVYAGWLRYLMAVDDNGKGFELSPDPLLEQLCPVVAGIKLGQTTDVEPIIRPILKDEQIFGVDLYEVGLANLVCQYFTEMIAGVGAVRATLEKYV